MQNSLQDRWNIVSFPTSMMQKDTLHIHTDGQTHVHLLLEHIQQICFSISFKKNSDPLTQLPLIIILLPYKIQERALKEFSRLSQSTSTCPRCSSLCLKSFCLEFINFHVINLVSNYSDCTLVNTNTYTNTYTYSYIHYVLL